MELLVELQPEVEDPKWRHVNLKYVSACTQDSNAISTVPPMCVGRNSSLAVYENNLNAIPWVNGVSDLGIVLSTSLEFTEYINACISKAYSRTFIIFKGFSCRNSLVLPKAFFTYVRPLLVLKYGLPLMFELLINSSVYNGALLNVFLLWLTCPVVTG